MSKAEKTRQFIIESSAAVINKKGIAGTSISDLMEVTNLAKGGIYGNFENKEEICLEAFKFLSSRAGRALDQAITSQITPKEKLFALLDYYRDNIATNETGGCPLLNFGIEADDTNPLIRQRVAKAAKHSQLRISKIVDAGKAAGEFKASIDSELFALKMFTMIQGAIFTSRVYNNNVPMTAIVNLLKEEINRF